MKKFFAMMLVFVLTVGFAACGQSQAEEPVVSTLQPGGAAQTTGVQPPGASQEMGASQEPAEETVELPEIPEVSVTSLSEIPTAEELFTDRDLEGTYGEYVTITLADGASRADGAGVTIQGDVITITQEGTYLLSGKLTNGQIAVEPAEDAKVQLVLAGAEVFCTGSAALYIREGDKIFLTLASDTENALVSQGDFVQTDNNTVDGAIFTKSDLTLNGRGVLTVECETGHGIVAKDDLKVTGGVYSVTSAGKGVEANDSFRMIAGDVTIVSDGDGVQVENEDTAKGYIYIGGGSLTVQAGGDGVSATGTLLVAGGVLDMVTGDESTADDASAKALKSDVEIFVTGGDITVQSVDDAVHTNGDVTISGTANLLLYSGDDAVHADNTVTVSGGSVNAPVCFEGLEGTNVNISGGYVSVVTSDDGLNAGGGVDGSGFGGRGGESSYTGAGNAAIHISGGEVYVNARGDGLDSNGSLYITGGTVYVNGPEESVNGTLDFDGVASVTGGTVVTTGPNSWLQNFGQESTQGSILCTFGSGHGEGTLITLVDNATGATLVSYTAVKNFQSVILSTPELAVGGSYTVTAGDESQVVELTSLIYGGGGIGGGKGGKGSRGGW